jgi:serine/threonine protein kinase
VDPEQDATVATSERTITPAATGVPPTREQVESLGRPLRPGDGRKADLIAMRLGDVEVVVKDFARKSLARRLLGRMQLARELRAYRQAGRDEALPAVLGRVDRHALALERVEGNLLALTATRFADALPVLRQLRRLIDRLHARGVAHLDLRGKSNVLLRPDGRIVVVDMGAAVCFRPGSLAHRLLFRWLSTSDETGFIKWKARLCPDLLDDDELRFLDRYRRLRRLWIFNRRHRTPAPARPGGTGDASPLPGRQPDPGSVPRARLRRRRASVSDPGAARPESSRGGTA